MPIEVVCLGATYCVARHFRRRNKQQISIPTIIGIKSAQHQNINNYEQHNYSQDLSQQTDCRAKIAAQNLEINQNTHTCLDNHNKTNTSNSIAIQDTCCVISDQSGTMSVIASTYNSCNKTGKANSDRPLQAYPTYDISKPKKPLTLLLLAIAVFLLSSFLNNEHSLQVLFGGRKSLQAPIVLFAEAQYQPEWQSALLQQEIFLLNLEDGYFGCQVNESQDFLQLFELSKLCDGQTQCYLGTDELESQLKCKGRNKCGSYMDSQGVEHAVECQNGVCLDGLCYCNDGFGGKSCDIADDNECKYRPCDVFAHCTNTMGSYYCSCFPGK